MIPLFWPLLVLASALFYALAWREGGTHRAGRGAYSWRLGGVRWPVGSRLFRAVPPAVGLAALMVLQQGAPWDWRAWASLAASLALGLWQVAEGHASHQDAGAVRVGDAWAPADGQTTERQTRWLDRVFGPETRDTPRWKTTLRDAIGNAQIGLTIHLAFAVPWAWTGEILPLAVFAAAGLLHFVPYLIARFAAPADPVAPAERGIGAVIGATLALLAAQGAA